jgi:hypothetical protein
MEITKGYIMINKKLRDKIWEHIDYLLDCAEYPSPGVFNSLPTVEGLNLRKYAKEELDKIIKND